MKYKIGDKVKIRDDLKANSRYSTNTRFKSILVVASSSMADLAGKMVTIKQVREGKYFLEENNHWWIDAMFSDKAERKFNGLLEQKEGKINEV